MIFSDVWLRELFRSFPANGHAVAEPCASISLLAINTAVTAAHKITRDGLPMTYISRVTLLPLHLQYKAIIYKCNKRRYKLTLVKGCKITERAEPQRKT